MISVVIPALNEEKTVAALLEHLKTLDGAKEVIVADGGSADATSELAAAQAVVVAGPRGRGPQCNAGAARAGGGILFFLHADSRLERDTLLKIEQTVADGAEWGCLKLRFDDRHWLSSVIAWCSNLRVHLRGIVFGDQGIFMTRELFERLGGLPELPLMEDYRLSLELREQKIPPVQVCGYITSSARRFARNGRLRTLWRMRRLRALYRRGADISAIQAMYADIR